MFAVSDTKYINVEKITMSLKFLVTDNGLVAQTLKKNCVADI